MTLTFNVVLELLANQGTPMTAPTLRRYYTDLSLIAPPAQKSLGKGRGRSEAVFEDPYVIYKLRLARDLLKTGFSLQHTRDIISRPGKPVMTWEEEKVRFDRYREKRKITNDSYVTRTIFRHQLISLEKIAEIWDIDMPSLKRFMETFLATVQTFYDKKVNFLSLPPIFNNIAEKFGAEKTPAAMWQIYLTMVICQAAECHQNRITYIATMLNPAGIVSIGSQGRFLHNLIKLVATQRVIISSEVLALDTYGRSGPMQTGRWLAQYTEDAARGRFYEKIINGVPSYKVI